MEVRKKERKVLRALFTRAANEFESTLTTSDPSDGLREVQVRFEMLSSKHGELKRLDSEIYSDILATDFNESDLTAEIDTCDSYEKRFVDLKVRYDDVVQRSKMDADERATVLSAVSDAVGSTGAQGRRKFKLPILEFKKFDGNIKEWLPFWAQFRKIDEDPDIDQSDKIEYLIQATVPNSRARRLVESYPAVGDNYDKIVSALKTRFGRDDLQIEVYIRELLKLILGNATSANKLDLSALYDTLETQLRALETLGVTSEKCSAMLFPLIESCLPEDSLRVWQRSGKKDEASLDCQLNNLMTFLKNEVDNEQRIVLAAEGFGLRTDSSVPPKDQTRSRKPKSSESLSTASGLVNCDISSCVFCEGNHDSPSCFKAQKFTLEHKRDILTKKKACYRCLKVGHTSKKCRGRMRCLICSKSHVIMMCPDLPANQQGRTISTRETGAKEEKPHPSTEQSLANSTSEYVFLETLRVTVIGKHGSFEVRALIDGGSQRSYILKSTAQKLGLISKRSEKLVHCLFGGTEQEHRHECFDVQLSQGSYSCTFEALDQCTICRDISPVFYGPWSEELKRLGIKLVDDRGPGPIELLIGADICGKLYTGRRHILDCGLVAVETFLGWTISGKAFSSSRSSNLALSVISLHIHNSCVSDLWKLDVLGISEPSEKLSRDAMALAAKELFQQTVRFTAENRYEVQLPWLEGHPPLPSNYGIAKKRLESTVRKLRSDGLLESYNRVFQEWLEEKIIEEVPDEQLDDKGHYLPHRPVVKEASSTTKIRPVFDASAREKNNPSLNHCLEKGVNLIELIPSILLRFRADRIGVVADIRKAFLQISVHKADRDFLRFLWINQDGKVKTYRHRRVVFGISSSPFLLGATIEHHLGRKLKECKELVSPYSQDTVLQLSKSFYVDNCVTSVPDVPSLEQFREESSRLMSEASFDLRGWEFTQTVGFMEKVIPVLGLSWSTEKDTLSISGDHLNGLEEASSQPVTKRIILSVAQRVFDPIGFTCPATLKPKLLLQALWEQQAGWDTPLDSVTERVFHAWLEELPVLFSVKIPRWIQAGRRDGENRSLHTFCDASKDAYAAVVFIRTEWKGKVAVHLLAAKSRVAPLKKISIPRLELLAATIGVRLWKSVKENVEVNTSHFWSDSSTVISWIKRTEEWAPFVGNRVAEIRSLAPIESWRHVSGTLNPADLPSRGCSPKHLLESKWWEGPEWLAGSPGSWVQENFVCNEEEINKEKKKRVVASFLNCDIDEWHLRYFSKYSKTIRMIAWILRFVDNIKNSSQQHLGTLTAEEIERAETFVLRVTQGDTFSDEEDERIFALHPFRDKNDLIRLKSRVSNRQDIDQFRFPVVLPAKHPVVTSLIRETHERSCHVGTQGLLSILREKFWILGGRRSVRSVIAKCVVCRRQCAKPFVVNSPPLPIDRVRDAVPFEVTGIDFAGPLYLKSNQKAWVCLFTCAVYRAVHLELTLSLSAAAFMQAFRRFVSRRGRPKTIYTDRGTNFVGTEGAFSKLDWDKIAEETATQRIVWRFNPPTAAWWGGFWERLIGIMKRLLRKVLGRASLHYEELSTILCECEAVINSRPLTYLSSDAKDMVPLTPAMFLRDLADSGLPDCDAVDRSALCRRMRYKQKLRDDLRLRFRNEYLGMLKLLCKRKKHPRPISVGEMVLIGNDHDKRLNWPLGRVCEVLPGKDGVVRLVRVDTARGQLLRPVQRVYPLECGTSEEESAGVSGVDSDTESRVPVSKVKESAGVPSVESDTQSRVPVSRVTTRSGRVSRLPSKFVDSLM